MQVRGLDPKATEPRTVGTAEVAEQEASLQRGYRAMMARDGRVPHDELVALRRTDSEIRSSGDRLRADVRASHDRDLEAPERIDGLADADEPGIGATGNRRRGHLSSRLTYGTQRSVRDN